MKRWRRGSVFIDLSPIRQSADFRLIWLAQLISVSGRQVVTVAVAYQVYVLTRSSLAVGLLGLFQALPIIAAGLYGGALADRFDRRSLQMMSKTAIVSGSILLVLSAATHRLPVAVLYLVVAVSSAAGTVDQTAARATMPRLVPARLLPAAVSLAQAQTQSAAIIGPAVAGLMLARVGLTWTYAADVIGFLPAILLISRVSPQPQLREATVVVGLKAPLEAIGFVRRNRLIVGLFASDLVAMIFGMPTAVFPALALSVFKIGPEGLGLLYAAPAAGALLGSVLSGWTGRVSRQGIAVFLSIAIWGAAVVLFGLVGHWLWVGLLLLALAGVADLVSAIFRNTILQLSIPDSMRGRMSAFHLMVATSGPRLGDLEAGAVASLVSPVFSVVSGGVACAVGIVLLAAVLPEMRRYRFSPESKT